MQTLLITAECFVAVFVIIGLLQGIGDIEALEGGWAAPVAVFVIIVWLGIGVVVGLTSKGYRHYGIDDNDECLGPPYQTC